jgi:dihydroorotase-like cyclic amidohydrolase
MSTKPYDLVLRGGTVATSSAVFPADVAIDGETIAAVGRNLPPGAKEIDARGKLVLPGGVDRSSRSRPPVSSMPTRSKAPPSRRRSAAPPR